MRFGTKYKDESEEARTSGTGGTRFIKAFKSGDTEIRFLEEMSDWTGYFEHFDPTLGKNGASYPCTGDRKTCPGCTNPQERVSKAKKRYLVNALVNGYVDLYKIPVSLIDRLVLRADRDHGTLVNVRSFIINKSGSNLDTEYDVERGDESKIDLASFRDKFQDHQQALAQAYQDALGVAPDDELGEENQDPEPPRRAVQKDKEPDKPKATPTAAEVYPDDPPSEPVAEPTAEAGEDVEMTEDQLRAMSASEVKQLFVQCGLDAPDTDDAQELVDALIKALA